MSLGLQYKDDRHIFDEAGGSVPYLEYPMLRETGIIRHGFSTRLGGVSEGCWASMNLSFERGDRPEAVMENFRRIGAELGVRCEDMVLSQQTHTANVRVVTGADRGKGITRERDYTDVDGLITNEPGICLVTSFADCVPLYFVDPVKKAIGLSHSGWRGTVGKIGKRTVEMMGESFGSDPADILAAVGPSVCMDCYEVSGDVIEKFRQVFDEKLWPELFYEKENGKCQLDLWKANELIFLESGILPEHMAVTNLCTHCNSEILYSHRAAGDKRGNLCAFLALKEG
ncbi:MAG TPA: peptidoglycan editing factor PgeF [Candidatus Mediterraneibacter faecigallinarum]|uniref:Purine nucleoside phosphorylase n=1 Tax=Candidatus Mediterraneibacter faecigallinarum TaxID=2838669 RepID=A0A9D2SYW1_9FIRM|nr:peptidoglycan editing factor PgeF [Candidatus Mediterraneibacter faecigallinarum]